MAFARRTLLPLSSNTGGFHGRHRYHPSRGRCNTMEEDLEHEVENTEEELQSADCIVYALVGYMNPQMTKIGGFLKQQPIIQRETGDPAGETWERCNDGFDVAYGESPTENAQQLLHTISAATYEEADED
ncbi:hypothetical protein BHE74_00052472 [Ensete ventricosum]|nr:hypothetical protein BHE74_00052472 [Ensete ventricosum]RZS26128.1 hypothetical protein BHM03_00059433 [Ensete ventricosum]